MRSTFVGIRKWATRSTFRSIHELRVTRNSGGHISIIAQFNSICENDDDFWMGRLDHKDWLAPNEMLKIFRGLRDPELVVFALKKASSRKDYKPNEALYSLIIDKLASARKFDVFEELLKKMMSEKCKLSDEFFYKLIKIYANVANHPEQAINTLFKMPDFRCWPTVKTFNFVLHMLVCNKHFEIVHEVYVSASKLGVAVDTCTFNILIKGLCIRRKLDAAFSLLHEIPKQGCKPNVTTYSTLAYYLCKHDRVNEAFALCERMEAEGCDPDTITFNILISGLCKQGRVAEGMDLLKKMKLKGCYPNSGTYQVLLYGLLSLEKFVEAKSFMNQMLSDGICPSALSYKLILNGLCADENLLNDIDPILRQMVHHGFVPRMGTWKKILRSINLKMSFSKFLDCYNK